MILLTTQSGFLMPIAWLLGKIFNGLFELIFLMAGKHPWLVPIVAIGIVLFTIVIRMLLLPLTIKQQKFSKLQNMMNPEIQEIQAKYNGKKDNESMMKMNEETKEVYAKYGASPSGGCLVMIIQLPIMFALYRVIYKIPGYVAKIKAISAVVAIISVGALNNGATADFNALYVNDAVITSQTQEDADGNSTTEYSVVASVDSLDAATLNAVIDIVYNFTSDDWSIVNEQIGSESAEALIESYDIYTILSDLGYSDSQIKSVKTTLENIDSDSDITVQDLTGVIEGYNSLFGLNLMEHPWNVLKSRVFSEKNWKFLWIVLIPLLAGASQFASSMLMMSKNKQVVGQNQSETQESMQQSMKMMNYFMPLISVFFCFTLPSCIGIYWIASSVIQMIIQLVINNKMDHMDVAEMVQKNIDKENEKRAKKGLPPKKFVNSASTYAEDVKKQEARDARKDERDAQMKKSTEYYSNGNTAKPGSLAAKANMVKMFNERNNVDKSDKN